MNIIQKLRKILFCSKYKEAKRKQQFILAIITTQSFSRMSPQDKITSLAKLIFLFECDHGYSPKRLEDKLVSLNLDLKRQVIEDWGGVYSGVSNKKVSNA